MYQVSNQLKNLLVECYTNEYADMSAEELLESEYFISLSYKMQNLAKAHTSKYVARDVKRACGYDVAAISKR